MRLKCDLDRSVTADLAIDKTKGGAGDTRPCGARWSTHAGQCCWRNLIKPICRSQHTRLCLLHGLMIRGCGSVRPGVQSHTAKPLRALTALLSRDMPQCITGCNTSPQTSQTYELVVGELQEELLIEATECSLHCNVDGSTLRVQWRH